MVITSLDNKKVKEVVKLQSKKYRDSTNTFVVETEHLVEEAFKAGIVKDAFDYPYSSYAAYISQKEDSLLSKDEILAYFQGDREEQYKMFVEGVLPHEDELLIQKDIGEDENWLPK